MASTQGKMRLLETVASVVLVTIGLFGLLVQTNILVIPVNLPASFTLLKWWPLALVGLGALQLALYGANRERQ